MEPYQPGAYWYSKLSDFRNCARMGQLKHIDKVKIEQRMSGDLEFGSAMHAGLNDLITGGDGVSVFELFWGALKDVDMDYGRLSYETLAEMGPRFLERFQRLHLKHFKLFKAEERIHAPLEGYNFEGTPDCLADYKGVPSVIDFKTAAYRYDKRKIVCDEQMPLYGALAKAKYGYEAKQLVYVVFIKDPKLCTIQTLTRPLTDKILYNTIQNVTESCADLESRKSYPKNTSHCVRGTLICPYFNVCHPDEGVSE